MSPIIKERVLAVYAAVDAAVSAAAPKCDASGRCCRFAEFGHTLYLSHFEAEVLLESAPPFHPPASAADCPFQVNSLCTARHERPLGCRVYFCDPAFGEDRQSAITEAALDELKRLADEFDTGWRYAPLHAFLNAANRPQDGANAVAAGASRMSLPLA